MTDIESEKPNCFSVFKVQENWFYCHYKIIVWLLSTSTIQYKIKMTRNEVILSIKILLHI